MAGQIRVFGVCSLYRAALTSGQWPRNCAYAAEVVTRNSQWVDLGELRDFAGIDGDIVYVTGVKAEHINLSVGHVLQAHRKEFLGRIALVYRPAVSGQAGTAHTTDTIACTKSR